MDWYRDLLERSLTDSSIRGIPVGTKEHIWECKRSMIYNTKGKIKIFTPDFYANYREFVAGFLEKEAEIISIEKVDEERVRWLLDKNSKLEMYLLDIGRIKSVTPTKGDVPSFIVNEPMGVYWEGSMKDNRNAMVLGCINSQDVSGTQNLSRVFENLKTLSKSMFS